MNTKLTLSALLIAALPLAAQADNAAERALRLNQEPLSSLTQAGPDEAAAVDHFGGGSEAMQKARAALQSRNVETRFAISGDDVALAREATS